jgi:4-hydroxy-3-polyprenylbenzoate decarboxylase
VPLSAANVWLALEKAGVTDVQGVWEYQTRYITAISIKQKYGGHAKRTAMAMLGSTYGYHRRFVIIVDDDVDPSNIDDVLWALATRCDPATAINVITDALEHAARSAHHSGCPRRAQLHRIRSPSSTPASRTIGKISMPRLATFPEETRRAAAAKWKDVLKLD